MIDLFKPYMTQREVGVVSEVLLSGWTGLGPKTKEFEDKFAEYTGVNHAIAVNSCTAALDLALKLIRVNHGDEVIVPTMTFVSTAHVVAYNHATPIFCDIDPSTLLINFDDLERKITQRTKAIIVVHFGGMMVDLFRLKERLSQIGREDIKIIEDCAHACGSSLYGAYGWYPAGSIGDIGCFSFHSVKNLSIGDGGMITTNSKEWADRAKKLRWLGIDKGTWDRSSLDKSYWWEYTCNEIGHKCHMNDISAAIGLVQLDRLTEMNRRRKEIVELYLKLLQPLHDSNKLMLPVLHHTPRTYDIQNSHHLFWIKIRNRNDLIVKMKENEINAGVHYKPIHLYKCYGNTPVLPYAENVWERLISLPIHPQLTDEDVGKVVKVIEDFANNEFRI